MILHTVRIDRKHLGELEGRPRFASHRRICEANRDGLAPQNKASRFDGVSLVGKRLVECIRTRKHALGLRMDTAVTRSSSDFSTSCFSSRYHGQ
jgi:hypothetical protein